MYELSDIHHRTEPPAPFSSFPRAESRINNTERPRSLAHPSDPALRQFLFRLDTHLQLHDRLLLVFTLPNLHCRKVHTNTRKVPDIPVKCRICTISNLRSCSQSSSPASSPTTEASFQVTEAVKTSILKPLYVRLKMRCIDYRWGEVV
jgi:hypothetical protein